MKFQVHGAEKTANNVEYNFSATCIVSSSSLQFTVSVISQNN